MKTSIYNMYFDNGNNTTIYNSLSGKIINIEGITSKEIVDLIEKNNISSNISSKLISYGIITQYSETLEKVFCDSVFFSNVYNNKLSITLITTTNCNFRCQYCAQEHVNKVMSNDVYKSIKKFIIKNISNYSIIKITLFGGEPTLEYDNYSEFLDDINDLCKFYKRKFEGVIISNGYLLNEQLIRRLYSKNITQYQITLDGSQENHDKCRCLVGKKGTFNEVYNNLINILKSKDLKRLSVAIRINATKELLEDIDNWWNLYEPFSQDKRFLINLGVVQDRGGEYIKDFDNSLISETDELYYKAKARLSHHTFYEDFITKNYFVCKDISSSSYTFDCDASVRACSNIYIDNIIGHLDELGNIVLNNNLIEFKAKSNPLCSGCVVEPLCHGKSCGVKNICDKENILLTVKNFVDKKSKSAETIHF